MVAGHKIIGKKHGEKNERRGEERRGWKREEKLREREKDKLLARK